MRIVLIFLDFFKSIFNAEFRDAFRRILVRYVFKNETASVVCSRLVACRCLRCYRTHETTTTVMLARNTTTPTITNMKPSRLVNKARESHPEDKGNGTLDICTSSETASSLEIARHEINDFKDKVVLVSEPPICEHSNKEIQKATSSQPKTNEKLASSDRQQSKTSEQTKKEQHRPELLRQQQLRATQQRYRSFDDSQLNASAVRGRYNPLEVGGDVGSWSTSSTPYRLNALVVKERKTTPKAKSGDTLESLQ